MSSLSYYITHFMVKKFNYCIGNTLFHQNNIAYAGKITLQPPPPPHQQPDYPKSQLVLRLRFSLDLSFLFCNTSRGTLLGQQF